MSNSGLLGLFLGLQEHFALHGLGRLTSLTCILVVAARRCYNEREGWTPAEDTLPARFFDTPLTAGPSAGAILTRAGMAEMKAAYHAAREYDSNGRVPESLRRDLGLSRTPPAFGL